MNRDNSIKLIIGTFSCNLLVAPGCIIDDSLVIRVGPLTNSFKPSNQTQIFLSKKSVENSLTLLSNNDCCHLYPYDQLEQLKQVWWKFYREEMYTKCRCASVIINPTLQGKVLQIFCDNTTSIAYVKSFGGVVFSFSCYWKRLLRRWLANYILKKGYSYQVR